MGLLKGGAEETAKLRANLLAGQSTLEGFLGQQRQQHRQMNDSLTLTSKSKDWDNEAHVAQQESTNRSDDVSEVGCDRDHVRACDHDDPRRQARSLDLASSSSSVATAELDATAIDLEVLAELPADLQLELRRGMQLAKAVQKQPSRASGSGVDGVGDTRREKRARLWFSEGLVSKRSPSRPAESSTRPSAVVGEVEANDVSEEVLAELPVEVQEEVRRQLALERASRKRAKGETKDAHFNDVTYDSCRLRNEHGRTDRVDTGNPGQPPKQTEGRAVHIASGHVSRNRTVGSRRSDKKARKGNSMTKGASGTIVSFFGGTTARPKAEQNHAR